MLEFAGQALLELLKEAIVARRATTRARVIIYTVATLLAGAGLHYLSTLPYPGIDGMPESGAEMRLSDYLWVICGGAAALIVLLLIPKRWRVRSPSGQVTLIIIVIALMWLWGALVDLWFRR